MQLHLRYEKTVEDHIAKFERFTNDSVVARRFLRVAYFTICGLAWLSAILFYVKQGDRSLGYVAYGTLALFLTVGLPRMNSWYQRSVLTSVLTSDSLQGLLGPTELLIEDESVQERGVVTTVRAPWRAITRVERDAERTYLFVAPLIAIVVPHSAFLDPSDLKEFDKIVQERVGRSQSGVAPAVGLTRA